MDEFDMKLKVLCDEIVVQQELISTLYLYINMQKKEIDDLKW